MIKEVKQKTDYYIEFTEEEMDEFGFDKNQKFTLELLEDEGGIRLTPFAKIDIDLSEFDRETLEFLIKESVDNDISVNEVLTNVLTKFLEKNNYGNV